MRNSELERGAPGRTGVVIELTDEQVGRVVREAAGGRGGVAALLAGPGDLGQLRRALSPLLFDQAYSNATLMAFMILAAFPADGTARAITAVARDVGRPASTTFRYVRTLRVLGVLEQLPGSRKYRRAVSSPALDAE